MSWVVSVWRRVIGKEYHREVDEAKEAIAQADAVMENQRERFLRNLQRLQKALREVDYNGNDRHR